MVSINKEKGQTLVVILVLMVLSLSIGVALSAKYISGLRNITQSGRSAMAVSVAESAIERLLLLPIATLEDYAANGSCGADCHLEIEDEKDFVSYADVTLTTLGSSTDPYVLDMNPEETAQLGLLSYPSGQNVYICWNSSEMSISGLYIYGTLGNYLAEPFSYNPIGSSHPENGFTSATSMFGYTNCFTVVTKSNSVMLRLRSYYERGIALAIPAEGNSLPTQGILMDSTGVSQNSIKKVSVIISDPILPAHFDYVLMQKSLTDPLSN